MQRVTPCIVAAFSPVEQALQKNFLPALFQGLVEGTPRIGITCIPVKQAGLELPDPKKTAPENWMVSCVIIVNLVAALRDQEELQTAEHSTCLREGRPAVHKRSIMLAEEALADPLVGGPVQGARRLRRSTKTMAWLMVRPSTVNGTEISVQEWQDSLFLRYSLEPPYLPHYCNDCNATFSIRRSLDFKWGGLFTACHNKLCDRVADLAGKAFTPYHFRNNPLIFAGCVLKIPKLNPARSKSTTVPANRPLLEAMEQNGGLLIRDLCHNGTDSAHYMRVMNTDSKSHLAKTPEKCLQELDQKKNKIYLESCLQQFRHFSPFVASVDGMLGVEATATLKRIASRLAKKWRKP